MNQGLALERRLCARNAGVFILVRILLGSLVFLSLGTVYYVPGTIMLTAAQSVKANVLFFIGVICVLVIMSLFSLIIAFPLNNTLSSVDKNLSLGAAGLRLLEVLIFIAGIVLLFAEISFFYQVLLVGLIFYGLYLTIIGYLVFKSGYLSRALGIFLILGGSLGYLSESMIHFFAPTLIWFSYIGVLIAVAAEISLAVILVMTARRMIPDLTDTRETVIRILENLGEATTTEIITEASKVSPGCKDRVPNTLIALENDNEITKRMSKEKKGFVWTLVS